MDITHDDIDKAISNGDPAGKFNPKTIVYSEMAVRAMIYNALCHFKKRHLSEQSSRQDKAVPNCLRCGQSIAYCLCDTKP